MKIIDTAGIRKTDNKIEQIGVKKALKIAEEADLIIAIIDNSKELEIEAPKVEIEQEADHSDLIRNVTAISLAAIIGGISVGKVRHKKDEKPKIKEKKNK